MVLTRASDPYTILGVERSATDAAITSAHRRLARTFHPDVAGDEATADMMRINAAFDLIRDRRRRAAYTVSESEQRGDVAESRHRAADAHTGASGASGASGDPDAWADPSQIWARERDGTGGAGRPPGRPSGSILPFGRHIGWSIGEVARADPGYLVWLEERPDGRPYLQEIDRTLRHVGYRPADQAGPATTRSRFARWSGPG